ncbi:MAG: non-canonical purine NTP diphosphatase [Tannerellaceae bacterium]|jgi:XTP/dITP diphosphohydrolase|nr:non-canonical purine NTP diphosphatase [Tannerellaceae bacterium]
MHHLVFATHNKHKLAEAAAILGSHIRLFDLSQIGCSEDIPETASTLEGNALIKARYVNEHYGFDCFADDTGLEVEALGNAPGVSSARYAGEPSCSEANISKLLSEMQGIDNRRARFRTVIALIINSSELHCFEGIASGRIIAERRGNAGFGYDSVFVPDGHQQTFAEMPSDLKNSISHRAIAIGLLADFIKDTL